MRDLLTKVVAERMPDSKQHAVNNLGVFQLHTNLNEIELNILNEIYIPFLVSLPRLVGFDWRVDVKTSAGSLARMAVPTCLLQLQVSKDHGTDINTFVMFGKN